jgi:hypothetical protein
MTWLAVMIGPSTVPKLTVPSTRTLSPFAMVLAEVGLVPFRYVVENAVSTVTVRPADVEIAKLDVDTLATVPAAPPVAGPERGPERALKLPQPGAPCPDGAAGHGAAAAGPESLPGAALTMPQAPPATEMAVTPTATDLVSLRENIE